MLGEVKDLTRGEYEYVRRLVYAKSGINLGGEKMQLVRARLGKRVRQKGFKSFRQYLDLIERDVTGEELAELLDAISTNTTHLFREKRHFELLREIIQRYVSDRSWRSHNRSLRIWSAGCSSGEEPHSIAMTAAAALENHPDIELKILATDLSVQMLSRAKLGLYEPHRVGTVPGGLKQRFFNVVQDGDERLLQLVPEMRRSIKFARFNLMTPTFPFKHPFHVVFCRNVMIYFDRPTQQTLVNKFAAHLKEGGYLMIGHSESLNGLEHGLAYVEPTVYRKD